MRLPRPFGARRSRSPHSPLLLPPRAARHGHSNDDDELGRAPATKGSVAGSNIAAVSPRERDTRALGAAARALARLKNRRRVARAEVGGKGRGQDKNMVPISRCSPHSSHMGRADGLSSACGHSRRLRLADLRHSLRRLRLSLSRALSSPPLSSRPRWNARNAACHSHRRQARSLLFLLFARLG